jgi:hypothetical protein
LQHPPPLNLGAIGLTGAITELMLSISAEIFHISLDAQYSKWERVEID